MSKKILTLVTNYHHYHCSKRNEISSFKNNPKSYSHHEFDRIFLDILQYAAARVASEIFCLSWWMDAHRIHEIGYSQFFLPCYKPHKTRWDFCLHDISSVYRCRERRSNMRHDLYLWKRKQLDTDNISLPFLFFYPLSLPPFFDQNFTESISLHTSFFPSFFK